METKILIIGNIKKDDSVLMRKKFAGSEPYKETWYSFGVDFIAGENPAQVFKEYVKDFVGINVTPINSFFWDTEIKKDHDGIEKQFIYLDLECEYLSGEVFVPEDLEKVEWITLEKLKDLDVVPPSVEMFKRLGYLQ